jgi:heat shock protein 5
MSSSPSLISNTDLGIETTGGVVTPLIRRGKNLPPRKSRIFSTAADDQNDVQVRVYRGERPLTKNDALLGTMDLGGIPLAPGGVPQVEVMFDLNEDNNILTVSRILDSLGSCADERKVTAIEQSTGKSHCTSFDTERMLLSEQEIERRVEEADENFEQGTSHFLLRATSIR